MQAQRVHTVHSVAQPDGTHKPAMAPINARPIKMGTAPAGWILVSHVMVMELCVTIDF